jgi:hypothetical protein
VEKAVVGKGGGVKFKYPEGSFRQASGALRVSPDLTTVDTLMFFGDVEQVTVEAPWGPWALVPAAPRQTFVAHSDDPLRICIGDSGLPEVSCFHPDGERTVMRWIPDRRPVTDEEVRAWREAHIRDLGEKLDERQVREVLAKVPIRRVHPPFSGIHLDLIGNLWVELGPSVEQGSRVDDYMIFDEGGALLGTVTLPSFRVMEIGADYVVGVSLDEFEVQQVQVFPLLK